jgi:hypothetical protein
LSNPFSPRWERRRLAGMFDSTKEPDKAELPEMTPKAAIFLGFLAPFYQLTLRTASH